MRIFLLRLFKKILTFPKFLLPKLQDNVLRKQEVTESILRKHCFYKNLFPKKKTSKFAVKILEIYLWIKLFLENLQAAGIFAGCTSFEGVFQMFWPKIYKQFPSRAPSSDCFQFLTKSSLTFLIKAQLRKCIRKLLMFCASEKYFTFFH